MNTSFSGRGQSSIQSNFSTNCILAVCISKVKIINNDIRGEFSVAAIWSDTIDLNATIAWNIIYNVTSTQHAIEFTTTATGMIMHNAIYTDASPTSIDPGSMMCIQNFVTDTIDQSGEVYPALP